MKFNLGQKSLHYTSALFTALLIAACGQSNAPEKAKENSPETTTERSIFSDITKEEKLKGLTIQMVTANVALPFCEDKECLSIDVQSLVTEDPWLDQWIEQRIAHVVLDQIDSKQALSLQQAVNRFVESSDHWLKQQKKHQPYSLKMSTRIAMQRNEYVLLQVLVDAKIKDVDIQQRSYFFTSNRKTQQQLSLLDVIAKDKQTQMHQLVQQQYQEWLDGLTAEERKAAPKTLYWGQADWFFDEEGIGLHYRSQQIAESLPQFAIYLTQAQTKTLLDPTVYQVLFED